MQLFLIPKPKARQVLYYVCMFELELKPLNFLKDKNELVELTKQAVKFNRFVLEKDVDEYATRFFLSSYKNSSIALGAYINNELKGFILFSSLKKEAVNKDFPKELYEIVKKKFADYVSQNMRQHNKKGCDWSRWRNHFVCC